jgi:hypothetical protein
MISSGPITIVIKEGMVSVGKIEFSDTQAARSCEAWPESVLEVFRRIERRWESEKNA